MKKFTTCTIIIFFLFTNGCASLTVRFMAPYHHRPGTLYPGTQQYISIFTEKQHSSNHEAYLLRDPGFLVFVAVLVPFIVTDMLVTTPVYDTVAFPWDAIRRLMRDDTIENNFEKSKASLIQQKLNFSDPDYSRAEVVAYKKDNEVRMIELSFWKGGGVQFKRGFYFINNELRLVIQKVRTVYDDYDEEGVCRLYFEDNHLLRNEACPEDYELSEEELINQASALYQLAVQNEN